jgi:hypothetical protein
MDLLNFGTLSGCGTPGTAMIIIDPVLTFGPGFDSTGYSLVFSPGVANGVANAPEPSAATLLLPGSAALLFRRQSFRGR